jgi:hypothetical protein
MLFYPAALPLSRQTLAYTAGIIRRHRKHIGSPWRKLNPGPQALLILAYLRKGLAEPMMLLWAWRTGVAGPRLTERRTVASTETVSPSASGVTPMRVDEERDPCSKADELLLHRLLAGTDSIRIADSTCAS